MSNENNLLLQSAHLRKNANYEAMNNDHEEMRVRGAVKFTKEETPEEDSTWKKYCTPLTIFAFSGTVLALVIILILIITYK